MLIIEFSFIIFGFFILIKSSDYLVGSAEIIARHFGLSELVIGFTIVAFGTSAPELMVNIQSALRKIDGFVLGNIFGSNIINILLGLGIAGLINPIKVQYSTIKIEAPFLAFITILLTYLLLDEYTRASEINLFSKNDAAIMFFFFLIFVIYNIHESTKNNSSGLVKKEAQKIGKASIIFLASCIGLHFGSDFIVNNAEIVGEKLNISKSVMGLSVLAIVTSLPEIVVCIRSAQRGNAGISVGGMIGSNLFNILLVLGVSTLIYPPRLDSQLLIDLFILNISSIALFVFIRLTKDSSIYKRASILFLSIYVFYILLKLFF